MYGYQCELCGASLDPGERCDCEDMTDEERCAMIRRRERAAVTKADKPAPKRKRKPYFIQHKTVYRR